MRASMITHPRRVPTPGALPLLLLLCLRRDRRLQNPDPGGGDVLGGHADRVSSPCLARHTRPSPPTTS